MKQKTIMWDVDGVLADFTWAFTKECGLKPWPATEQAAWDFVGQIDRKVQDEAWERIRKSTEWWLDVPALVDKNVFWRIDELARAYQTVFVTSRVGQHAQFQTERWLVMQGIQHPHVVVSHRKGDVAKAIDADYAIEDKPENAACIHWIADVKPCKTYIIDRPYNRTDFLPKRVKRVLSVMEFIEDIDFESWGAKQ